MRNIKLTIIFVVSIFLTACGGAATESKIEVKAGGKTMPLVVKSSGTYKSVKTFTDAQSKVTKASSNNVVLSSFDLDTSSGMSSMGKGLTANDQIRITLQFVGKEGTDEKTGFKTGTYTTKAEKFDKLDYVNVTYFAEGKESSNSFDIAKTNGEVKITSVSDDSVSGEIDLTEGEKSVKGKFTAKITVKK